MSNDKESPADDDIALFRDAVKGVRRLAADDRVVLRELRRATPEQSRRAYEEMIEEMSRGGFDYADLEYGDEAVFQRPTVKRTTMRRLRRGQIAVQAELDLHGLSLAEAKCELKEFIERCAVRGLTCVRVIHGKGHGSPGRTPVLKPNVAAWLARWNVVLAFCSARPADGGTGALYVLLRP